MGIEDWKMAFQVVMMRPVDLKYFFNHFNFVILIVNSAGVGLGGRMTKEVFLTMRREFEEHLEDIINVLAIFPDEILFMLRSTLVFMIILSCNPCRVLMRALNLDLGCPVNRYSIFGRTSARALRMAKIEGYFNSKRSLFL